MQKAINKSLLTEEDYLEMERYSEIKHEYHEGEIFAMAGASRKHNIIVANIVGGLTNQLRNKPCITYPSDMKLKVPNTSKYVYPDIMVTCGKEDFFDEEEDVLLNPLLIMEVLSDSTEKYDRGKKFYYYRKLKHLKEYVLVSQDEKKIETFIKNNTGYWQLYETDNDQEEITLASIDCTLCLKDVYEKVFVKA